MMKSIVLSIVAMVLTACAPGGGSSPSNQSAADSNRSRAFNSALVGTWKNVGDKCGSTVYTVSFTELVTITPDGSREFKFSGYNPDPSCELTVSINPEGAYTAAYYNNICSSRNPVDISSLPAQLSIYDLPLELNPEGTEFYSESTPGCTWVYRKQ